MRKCNKLLIPFLMTILILGVPISFSSVALADDIDPPGIGLDGADEKNQIRSGSNSNSGSSGPSIDRGGNSGPGWSDIGGDRRGGNETDGGDGPKVGEGNLGSGELGPGVPGGQSGPGSFIPGVPGGQSGPGSFIPGVPGGQSGPGSFIPGVPGGQSGPGSFIPGVPGGQLGPGSFIPGVPGGQLGPGSFIPGVPGGQLGPGSFIPGVPEGQLGPGSFIPGVPEGQLGHGTHGPGLSGERAGNGTVNSELNGERANSGLGDLLGHNGGFLDRSGVYKELSGLGSVLVGNTLPRLYNPYSGYGMHSNLLLSYQDTNSSSMMSQYMNQNFIGLQGASSELSGVAASSAHWTDSEGWNNFGAFMYGHREEGESSVGINSFVDAFQGTVSGFNDILLSAEQLGDRFSVAGGINNRLSTISMPFALISPGIEHLNHRGIEIAMDGTTFAGEALTVYDAWKDYRSSTLAGQTIPNAGSGGGFITDGLKNGLARFGGGLSVISAAFSAGETFQHISQGDAWGATESGLSAIGSGAFAVAMFFPPTAVVAGTIGAIATAGSLIVKYRREILAGLRWARDGIVKAGRWVGDRISDGWNAAVNLGTNIVNAATQAGQHIIDGASRVGNAISDSASNVGNAVSDGASNVSNAVSDGASNVRNSVSDSIRNVGNAFSDGPGSVGNAIVDGASNVSNAVVDGASNVVNAVGDGLTNVGNSVSDGLTNVGNAIGNEASRVGNAISNGLGRLFGN